MHFTYNLFNVLGYIIIIIIIIIEANDYKNNQMGTHPATFGVHANRY
jgi:hypothetical protein